MHFTRFIFSKHYHPSPLSVYFLLVMQWILTIKESLEAPYSAKRRTSNRQRTGLSTTRIFRYAKEKNCLDYALSGKIILRPTMELYEIYGEFIVELPEISRRIISRKAKTVLLPSMVMGRLETALNITTP